MKIKICGIRTSKVAFAAIDSGADYLGFNFVPDSRRFIDPVFAAKIIAMIKDKVQTVGIFQNADMATVREVAKQLDLDFVQLHGQENSEYIKQIHSRVIKAIHSPAEAPLYSVDYFLLDRVLQGEGRMVDAREARVVADTRPIFLAGGLTPYNVARAVRKIQPFAVDVASGIESDGVPDVRKIKEFIKNAKKVFI
ncbi:MAG: phosphoribosylanthranilate isomerase [Nanoarchaeota archaeon]|nr:phosphoribosylanthranilate isomerase [Nanoarchaeota archaeon]